MPLLDASDCAVLVIDAQPGFYEGRDDVDGSAFESFIQRAAWVVGVASALGVPRVETVERPQKNGDTAEAIRAALIGSERFEKPVFGAMGYGPIRDCVEGLGRRTAVLVGLETDVCVAHSAIGLLDLGYRVAAVTDALFAPGEAHAHGLERLRSAGAELVSAKGLFYEWLPSLEALRSFKASNPELRTPPGFAL